MASTLHEQLKHSYADDPSQTEVKLGTYRIDAVRGDELIEVQCASLSAIRDKCQKLLKRHPLRVVKPVVTRTRIVWLSKKGGSVTSRRWSPKRGSVLEVFDELIYFTRVFPHPNLVLEIPLIEVQQTRVRKTSKRRRWRQKPYQVLDVQLESIASAIELRQPQDLLSLLDFEPSSESFNSQDLADAIGRPRWHAQQIAYVLRKTGAIDARGRNRGGIIYGRAA